VYRSIIAILSIVAVPALAAAQDEFRNGRTCIAEICVGDGLVEVGKVKWDAAKVAVPFEKPEPITSYKVPDRRKVQIEQMYRGNLARALPYLAGSAFDQSVLSSLSGIIVCEHRGGIAGTFTDKSGNPIKVVITLVPDAKDVSIQHWIVTNIERHYVGANTEEKREAKRAEMDKVYAAAISTTLPSGRGMYHMSGDRLYLTLRRDDESYRRLGMHPSCATSR
jgi:hypothetical protein